MQTEYHIMDVLAENGLTTMDAGYRTFAIKTKRTITVSGSKCFGLTDFDKGEILIAANMAHDDARETLLHEIMHVVLEMCGLGGHEVTGIVTRRTNEEMVTLISRGLLLVMNLNPKLFEKINEQPPPQT